jgi:hypothetical protein
VYTSGVECAADVKVGTIWFDAADYGVERDRSALFVNPVVLSVNRPGNRKSDQKQDY